MASRSHVQYDRAIGGGYFGRRSVDPRTAFEIGYQEATDGMGDGANKVRDVKTNRIEWVSMDDVEIGERVND